MLMVFQGIFKDYVYNPSEDSKFAVEELKIYMDGNDL